MVGNEDVVFMSFSLWTVTPSFVIIEIVSSLAVLLTLMSEVGNHHMSRLELQMGIGHKKGVW